MDVDPSPEFTVLDHESQYLMLMSSQSDANDSIQDGGLLNMTQIISRNTEVATEVILV